MKPHERLRVLLTTKDHRELCTHKEEERSIDVLAGLVAQQAEVDGRERNEVVLQFKRWARSLWAPFGYAFDASLETFILNFCRFATLSAATEFGKIVEQATFAIKPSDPHLPVASVLGALAVQPHRLLYARKVWKPMLKRDDVAAFAFRQLLSYSNADLPNAFTDLCQRFVKTDGPQHERGPNLMWLLALAEDRKLGHALIRRLRERAPVLCGQFQRMVKEADPSREPWAARLLPLFGPL